MIAVLRAAVRWTLLVALLSACSGPEMEFHEIRPESPLLSKVWITIPSSKVGGRVTFYPGPDATWRDLLEVDPCGPFYPGMDFDEAERRFGAPDERGEENSNPYVIYQRGGFRYRIEDSNFATGSIPFLLPEEEASSRKWTLRTYPLEDLATEVFHADVARFIDGTSDELTLMAEAGGRPVIHGRLGGRKVIYLYPTEWADCTALTSSEQG